jgi:PQQ-dependent dehydrogenase (methanol/ethanol family)
VSASVAAGHVAAAASVVLALACAPADEPAAAARAFTITPDSVPLHEAPAGVGAQDGEWTTVGGDQQLTRYTALADIDRETVTSLQVAWTFSTGVQAGHEAAPLVIGSTMYLVTPFPNRVFALDLTRDGASLKWSYEAPYVMAARGVACCDVVNRGLAHDEGRLYFATLDNHVVALEAESGAEIWRVRVGDIERGETMTLAPLVVGGRVVVGNSGGEFGVRGWIAALDGASGETVWKAYSTGPDSDVLIDETFSPFYAHDRTADLGVRSWPPDAWRLGGGTVWGWLSYDPAADLLYHGTGNPGPWNPELRPGDNKWSAAVFARDPETGYARWAYQWSPHDLYDHDGVNENVLVDLPWEGRTRALLLHPERNGYLYVMDRLTGELLSAEPFVHVTSSHGVDLETGRLLPVPEKEPRMGVTVRDICPAAPGAKDWQPSAWSPRTRLLYIPHNNLCMDWESVEVNYIAGTPYVGANVRYYAGPGGHLGLFTAWDPIAARSVWHVEEPLPVWSGALVTGGDVVFYGTMDGWFKALDARTGEELWGHRAGSGIIGQPISYRGPDGKQYVAVFSGIGGWPGAVVVNQLDTTDASAGTGWAAAVRSLQRTTQPGGTLYVFSLP